MTSLAPCAPRPCHARGPNPGTPAAVLVGLSYAGDQVLDQVARRSRAPGLDLRFATLAGADHGSSMAPATQRALAWALHQAPA